MTNPYSKEEKKKHWRLFLVINQALGQENANECFVMEKRTLR